MESWELNYTLTAEDYVRFSIYTWAHSPYFRQRRWSSRLGLASCVLIVGTLVNPKLWLNFASALPILLLSLVMAMLAVPLGCWSLRRSILRRVRDGTLRNILGPTRALIDSAGLQFSNAAGQSPITPWQAVVDVVNDLHAAYVYVTSIQAFILPCRAFPDP
jgi:hypothetical protein